MEPRMKRQLSGQYSYSSPVVHRAYSVSGGAGGYGTKISSASYGNRFGMGRAVTSHNYRQIHTKGSSPVGSSPMNLAIGNEKVAMQHLNDRLASYLETVRNLEKANSKLEIKIREFIEKKGPLEGRDYGKYNAIIADLRAKIFDLIKGNANLAISVDNAHLASDDFRVKLEYELSMRQTVEADVGRLRKLLDDTNVIRLHLESDIESLKEELISLRKNHETDVTELRTQIVQGSVNVDVDSPKGLDLAKILEELRAKYERIVLQNQKEIQTWNETQIIQVTNEVTESSAALNTQTTLLSETRRKYQALDIELQAAFGHKGSLEATLRDIEMRYNMELEKLNIIILRVQEELTQIRTDIQQSSRDYEHLLDIKVKLEAEIAEYRRLLEGGDLKLEDAMDLKKMHTKVVTLTQTLVDGKVVSESKDVKSSEKIAN